jgi:hypothetical protein
MTKRLAVSCGLVLVAMILACGSFVHFADWGSKDVNRLNREIARDLPSGSSVAQVEEWFVVHGMKPHHDQTGDRPHREVHVLVQRDYLLDWSGDILIVFVFDDDDRLMSHRVSWRPITF